MAKAIIWVRASTCSQEVESQKKELTLAASKDGFEKNDLIIIGEAGASAIKMNELYKKEVDLLLKTIDDNQNINTVYVWELSRLARNKVAFQEMASRLINSKIQLKCSVPQLKLLDDDGELNQGMELTFDLLITLAKQEMEIKKKRFARGKERLAEQGKYNGGAYPFGYRVDKSQNNRIVEDDDKAAIVKEIFDKYERGMSQPKLAKEMKETGRGFVTISLINNVLNNESYCGVKRKTKSASYERAYPQIISVEQYKRCRIIAEKNNTTANKAKNVYFAEHLVKCPSCGAFWSASGSKSSYHCSAAMKANSIWKYENHKKEKCTNKTSISINILDGILWWVALHRELDYIKAYSNDRIKTIKKEIEEIETKLSNIQPRIDSIHQKKDRLREMYIDGLSKEVYEKKSTLISNELNEIKGEEIRLKEILSHNYELLSKLDNYGKLNKIYREIQAARRDSDEDANISRPEDIIQELNRLSGGRYLISGGEEAKIRVQLYNIEDDKERHKIIHRHIKSVEVKPKRIKYYFESGWRDVDAKEILVHTYRYTKSLFQDDSEEEVGEQKEWFISIPYGGFNGRGPLILYMFPDVEDEETPMLYDYEDNIYYPFERIEEELYLDRFYDTTKKRKRIKEKEEAYKDVEGFIRIEDVMAMTDLKYSQVYDAINKGELNAINIRHKYFISPKDAEAFKLKTDSKKATVGDRISAFEVAKRFKLKYAYVLRRIRNGVIPYQSVNGHFYVSPKDAEDYFGKSSEPKKVKGG